MIACATLGLIIERLAYRPLRRAPRLTALITAIGVSLFLVNGAQLLFKADFKYYPSVTPQGEAARQAINAWIRHATVYQGVADFDAALRDPAQPERRAQHHERQQRFEELIE